MAGLARYLPEHGWRPTILTAPLHSRPPRESPFAVLETEAVGDIFSLWRPLLWRLGFKKNRSLTGQLRSMVAAGPAKDLVTRAMYAYQEILGFPHPEKAWERAAMGTARGFLTNNGVDAMISVCPVTCHLVARRLKQEFRIPWIVDFVDPWSQNHNYPYGRLRRYLDTRLEVATVAESDSLTAAAPDYARKEEQLHGRPVRTIPLGFDPELVSHAPTPLTDRFSITYTGTIYPAKQDVLRLVTAASQLVAEGLIPQEDLSIRFYGPVQEWLDPAIAAAGLGQQARQYGVVTKAEAIARQRESQLLLLLGWEDRTESGVYPLKTFEYLAAKRPILLTGGSEGEEIKTIVAEAKAGVSAVSVADIKAKLLDFYREYKAKGAVSYSGRADVVARYSYRNMAADFGSLLDGVTT